MRKLAEKTQDHHIRAVRRIAAYLERSPPSSTRTAHGLGKLEAIAKLLLKPGFD